MGRRWRISVALLWITSLCPRAMPVVVAARGAQRCCCCCGDRGSCHCGCAKPPVQKPTRKSTVICRCDSSPLPPPTSRVPATEVAKFVPAAIDPVVRSTHSGIQHPTWLMVSPDPPAALTCIRTIVLLI